ncbi:MAG TPA: matrixin family metalloprotease [Bryobacteraceae bacterium]|nr:matrixin family metalloprotease [Bryobacteraceae bacterium]
MSREDLALAGGTFVTSLGDDTALVSGGDRIQELGEAIPFSTRDKLSPELRSRARGTQVYLVELHPDVQRADAELLALRMGLQIVPHPDLAPHHILVRGNLRKIMSLADEDEIAYVLPAADDLIFGLHVQPCAALTGSSGFIGQYIATIGDGWDGPGLGSANLSWKLTQATGQLSPELVDDAIKRALAEWSRVVKINFSAAGSATAERTLNILWATGSHGDSIPFDGRGNVLAHTFYPPPSNTEPLAGDLHFDDQEPWNIGADIDVFSVVLHELGHALGLGHGDTPGSVMYPYYQRVNQLTSEDIVSIRRLYASGSGVVSDNPAATSPSNPTPVVPTTPTSPPPPTTPAPPSPGPSTPSAPTDDTQPPSLFIRTPASTSTTTRNASITVAGTATDNIGVVEVSWSTSTGKSGVATGTSSWQASVPLLVGDNRLTVRAKDAAGNVVSRYASVRRIQ